MCQYKLAKIYFFCAVLLCVAKPFLGFSMFSRVHPPAAESIFVKAFTKRKQEYVKNSSFDIETIAKQLANPVNQLFLLFSCLLSILFPLISSADTGISNRLLYSLKLSASSFRPAWLLNDQLII